MVARNEYNASQRLSSFKPTPLYSVQQPQHPNVHVEFNNNNHHHPHQMNSFYPNIQSFNNFEQQNQQQHQHQQSLMVHRLSTATITPSSYSNKMIDICTSPIKILNANSADQIDPKTGLLTNYSFLFLLFKIVGLNYFNHYLKILLMLRPELHGASQLKFLSLH